MIFKYKTSSFFLILLLFPLSLIGCTPNLDSLESEVVGVWSFSGKENGVEISECIEVIRENLEFKFYREVRRPLYNIGELHKRSLAKNKPHSGTSKNHKSNENDYIDGYEKSIQLIEGRWDFGRGRRFFVNAGYATSQDQMRIPKDGKRRRYHMMSIVDDAGEDYLVLHVRGALNSESYFPKRYHREQNCKALKQKVDAMPLADRNHEDFDLREEAAGAFGSGALKHP